MRLYSLPLTYMPTLKPSSDNTTSSYLRSLYRAHYVIRLPCDQEFLSCIGVILEHLSVAEGSRLFTRLNPQLVCLVFIKQLKLSCKHYTVKSLYCHQHQNMIRIAPCEPSWFPHLTVEESWQIFFMPSFSQVCYDNVSWKQWGVGVLAEFQPNSVTSFNALSSCFLHVWCVLVAFFLQVPDPVSCTRTDSCPFLILIISPPTDYSKISNRIDFFFEESVNYLEAS